MNELKGYYTQTYPEEMRKRLSDLNQISGKDSEGEIASEASRRLGLDGTMSDLGLYTFDRKISGVDPRERWESELPQGHVLAVEEMIAISMLGLMRIRHVDINARLTPELEEVGLETVATAQHLSDKLGADNLPQLTVHGSEISWTAEIAQDISRTFEKIKILEAAERELLQAITKLETKEKSKNGITAGEESALAVLLYRLGNLTGNLERIVAGLTKQIQVSERQFNRDRLDYLQKKTALAALSPKFKASPMLRLEALKQAATAQKTLQSHL